MSAVAALHQAALDAAVWASNPPHVIAETMAEELAAFVAAEELTAFQREELLSLTWALRTLADRLEVIQ